jgi:hypothetical protein
VRHSAHKECGKSHHRFIAHQDLFNDHGILHRDISVNNLLINVPVDKPVCGLLIDFDYSEQLEVYDEETMKAINKAADADTGLSQTSQIISIRTVRSYFINCPWQ